MFDGFGDVSVLYAKQLLDSAKEHIDGADILSQQVHFDISELERAFGTRGMHVLYTLYTLRA